VTLKIIRFALKVEVLLFPGGNPPPQMLEVGLLTASERKLAISVPEGSPLLRGWLESQSAPWTRRRLGLRMLMMEMALMIHRAE
jgi:hypothetical protein